MLQIVQSAHFQRGHSTTPVIFSKELWWFMLLSCIGIVG
jgi:hypothetical protein